MREYSLFGLAVGSAIYFVCSFSRPQGQPLKQTRASPVRRDRTAHSSAISSSCGGRRGDDHITGRPLSFGMQRTARRRKALRIKALKRDENCLP